jgi:hypothetical protein
LRLPKHKTVSWLLLKFINHYGLVHVLRKR